MCTTSTAGERAELDFRTRWIRLECNDPDVTCEQMADAIRAVFPKCEYIQFQTGGSEALIDVGLCLPVPSAADLCMGNRPYVDDFRDILGRKVYISYKMPSSEAIESSECSTAYVWRRERDGANGGYVYLIRTRASRNVDEPVYKIGMTKEFNKRIGGYQKGSQTILVLPSRDAAEAEAALLARFANSFVIRRDYGKEYFEGDLNAMVRVICRHILEE